MPTTADIGLSRLHWDLAKQTAAEAAEQQRIHRGIDETMRAVITRDARCNPVTGNGSAPRDETGQRGSGWADPLPLKPPPGQDIIKRLCDTMEPHGPNSKAG